MGREIFNEGEEIVRQDQNDLQALIEQEYNDDVLYRLFGGVDGFLANSFKVLYVSSTQVNIQDGRGFQYDNTQVFPEPKYRGIDLDAVTPQTLQGPHASLPRIDIIAVKSSRVVTTSDTRKYKATPGGLISNVSFNKSDKYSADISYVVGTPNASPVAPSTPSGYLKIAQIAIPAATGPASQADITDSRSLLQVATSVGVAVNTSAATALTTLGGSTPVQTVVNEVDAYIKALSNKEADYENTANAAKGANLIGFKSAVGGNWSPDPSVVKTALDQLVARLVVAESISLATRTVTTTDTLATLDGVVLLDTSGGGFTFTIPAASVSNKNRVYELQKITTDFNKVTLAGGFAGYINTNGETVRLINNGSTWRILARTGIHGVLVSTAIVNIFSLGVTNPTKGAGSPFYDKAAWYRNGSKLECFYNYWHNSAGTGGSGAQPYYFDAVPSGSGLVVDITNFVPGFSNGDISLGQCGTMSGEDNTNFKVYNVLYMDDSFNGYGGGGKTGVQFMRDGAQPIGITTGDIRLDATIVRLSAHWEIPITNW